MLGNFEHEALALILRLKRVEDSGQMAVELNVNNGASHLPDTANRLLSIHGTLPVVLRVHHARSWRANSKSSFHI
jgi:hypothetical protein